MFNKLNYFNKLICFMLIMVSIVVADNAYLYILFIIIAFLIGVLSNNFNISFLSILNLLIYFYAIQHINYIWIFKLFLIFIFLFILVISIVKFVNLSSIIFTFCYLHKFPYLSSFWVLQFFNQHYIFLEF